MGFTVGLVFGLVGFPCLFCRLFLVAGFGFKAYCNVFESMVLGADRKRVRECDDACSLNNRRGTVSRESIAMWPSINSSVTFNVSSHAGTSDTADDDAPSAQRLTHPHSGSLTHTRDTGRITCEQICWGVPNWSVPATSFQSEKS